MARAITRQRRITPEQQARIRSVGGQMANLCFNLSQHVGTPLSLRNAEVMNQLRREWDTLWHSPQKPTRKTAGV